MLGKKIYKNKFDAAGYAMAAEWCNLNNATIVDEGEFYRIVALGESAPPSFEEQKNFYENAVQAHLDATAQTRGYDNTYTCLSYRDSSDEKWKREANIFNLWRDSVWRKAHEILDAVMCGAIPQPTVEEVIAQLPKIEW